MNPNPFIFFTQGGTAYLKDPGVVLLAAPMFCVNAGLRTFLIGLDPEFETGYNDFFDARVGVLEQGAAHSFAGEHLVQLAGQLCYLSLGARRTTVGENATYLRKILSSGHGSVLEHANYTLLFYGIDRACTHELVRHRAGWAYSQLSQRYVDESVAEYVEPDIIANDPELHALWLDAVNHAHAAYVKLAEKLNAKLADPQAATAAMLPADADRTTRRKTARQAARSVLPNATETKIFVTANARALRHFMEQRGSAFAEPEIRKLAAKFLDILQKDAPNLFGDYTKVPLPDGTFELTTPYRKV